MPVLPLIAARQQLGAEFATVWLLTFDLPSQLGSFGLAFAEICPHLVLVTEIVGDDGVDIGQVERRIGVDDAFGVRAVLVFIKNYIDGNT
jgi:hypothetical protein